MTVVPPIGLTPPIGQTLAPSPAAKIAAPDWVSAISEAAHSAVQTLHQAEQVTTAGMAGKVDTQAVVQALTSAELTTQTVVAVRDKILSAYNDILHMNI